MKSLFGYILVCKQCSKIFVIHKCCYRGHKYCSEPCKKIGYDLSRKKARKHYDQSVEAKLDHCDRSKRYRQSLSLKSVTDNTSKKYQVAVNIPSHSHIDLHDLPEKGICVSCGKVVFEQRSIYNGGPV